FDLRSRVSRGGKKPIITIYQDPAGLEKHYRDSLHAKRSPETLFAGSQSFLAKYSRCNIDHGYYDAADAMVIRPIRHNASNERSLCAALDFGFDWDQAFENFLTIIKQRVVKEIVGQIA